MGGGGWLGDGICHVTQSYVRCWTYKQSVPVITSYLGCKVISVCDISVSLNIHYSEENNYT